MTSPYDASKNEGEPDELELAPETIQDLDVEDGDAIRGGMPRRCSDVDSGCL